ncbi:hypothetical protein [Micromonospora peucetia]|uniref:Lipoprotein n=1 Tax=Micromonospora peucetia TaxID=47871 RepID=A0A1C6W582_9ACTN|nr:hypothetical protein [Micromonospora peucetia]SCL73651.1 hypothetical protein GA0070608_5961 [Micromonospora peucetia]
MTRDHLTAQALAAAVLLTGGCANPTYQAPAAPATSISAGQPPSGLAADPDGVLPTRSAAADQAAATAAARFVGLWARPAVPAARWRAELRPYAVPAYADLLDTVDPANVPATRITAPARVVSASDTRAEVDVGTDAGVIRVVCVRDDQRWLVATVGRNSGNRR